MLALRWHPVDFAHDAIRVRETVHEGEFGIPKIESSRRGVPMSQPVLESLLAQRAVSAGMDGETLVFACGNASPLNPKNLLRRVLRPPCGELGLAVAGWHSFRHTHATSLGEVGEWLRMALAILGHSDPKTTLNVYTHAIPESQKRAARKVASFAFPLMFTGSAATESRQGN